MAGALKTAARKLAQDPRGAGKALRGIHDPELQGAVYRLHVGGPGGHRLFYYVPPSRGSAQVGLVVPIFLSSERRKDFNYDDVDVNALGADIVSDYRAGRFDAFGILEPEVVPECAL